MFKWAEFLAPFDVGRLVQSVPWAVWASGADDVRLLSELATLSLERFRFCFAAALFQDLMSFTHSGVAEVVSKVVLPSAIVRFASCDRMH